jgi:hypothetical protein
MRRLTSITTAICFFTGLAWLGTVAQAQAATVIDTLELKATAKEFCEGNPKFFGIFPPSSGSFCGPVLLNALSDAAFLAFSSA